MTAMALFLRHLFFSEKNLNRKSVLPSTALALAPQWRKHREVLRAVAEGWRGSPEDDGDGCTKGEGPREHQQGGRLLHLKGGRTLSSKEK